MKSVAALVFVGIALMLMPLGCSAVLGIQGCGPVRTTKATVNRVYVDAMGDFGSAYMVGTDAGVFEVSNGFLLGVWNADEVFSRIEEGHTYRFTTKGNRVVNFFFQQYPYVLRVEGAD